MKLRHRSTAITRIILHQSCVFCAGSPFIVDLDGVRVLAPAIGNASGVRRARRRCSRDGASSGAILVRPKASILPRDLADVTARRRRHFSSSKSMHSGSSPCVSVRDARGRAWRVKWGDEVHTETFAARLAWAAGYFVEVNYFVPGGRIDGAETLQRARPCIDAERHASRRALRARRAGRRQAFRRARLGVERQSVCRHARAERPEDRDDAGVELGQQGCPRRRARIEHGHLRIPTA